MAAPVIGIRPRLTPRGSVTLEGTHSLATGLRFCFLPALGDRELVRGYSASRAAGALTPSPTSFGAAINTSTGTSRYTFAGVPDSEFTGPLTMLWVGRTTVANNYGFFLSKRTTTASSAIPVSAYFQWNGGNAANTLIMEVARANATQVRTHFGYPTGGFVANRDYVVVFVMPADLSGVCTVYIDGLRGVNGDSGVASGSPTGSNEALTLGGRTADGLASAVVTNTIAFWDRALTPTDAAALYADPYCFLRY